MKKRIVYLILNGTDYGGSEKHTLDLFLNLPRESYEAFLIHTEGNPIGELVPDSLRDHVYGINRSPMQFLSIARLIRSLKPDILHLQAARGIVTGRYVTLINRLFFRSSYRIISTTHGWVLPHFKIVKLMEWLFLSFRSMDEVTIAVSEKSRLELIEKGYVSNKVKTIYNGIDLEPFQNIGRERNQVVHVGFVGRLVHQKGIDILMGAIEALKDSLYHFHIYGDGEYRDQIIGLENALGRDRVTYHGFVPSNEIHKAYDAIDVLIAPSIDEGLPYTFIEAMACGVPVIASDVGGVSEIVEDGRTGLLIKPNSVESLVDAIKNISYMNLSELSRDCMIKSKMFSLDRMIQNTMFYYDKNPKSQILPQEIN